MEYAEAGDGGRPFVLVHGFTGSRDDFADVLPALAAEGRTIAPDNRGHGGTTNPGEPAGYMLVASLFSPWLLFAAPVGGLLYFWPFGAAVAGIPINGILYLFLPLPMGFAYFRWVAERYAYRTGFRVLLAHGWTHRRLIEKAVKQLSTARYGWTWPAPWVRAWFTKNL